MPLIKSKDVTNKGYAYDISIDPINYGESVDENAINNSIENILGTSYGERVFNPSFGSILTNVLFETLTEARGEQILDQLIADIERWEDRIAIQKDKCRMELRPNDNSLYLEINYVVLNTGTNGTFSKRVAG